MPQPEASWVRAVLPMCLLGILEHGESYGYALTQQLGDVGIPVKGATLYPALSRLENDGDVLVRWSAGTGGPGRKYYSLSEQGQERLNQQRAAWVDLTRAVARVGAEAGEHELH